MSREGAGPLVVTLRVTTIGPMGALPLVDKTSELLTWTHTLCFVSSGLPGSIGPVDGYAATCSVGRHWAGTTEHGSGTAKQRSTGFSDRVPDGAGCKDLSAYLVGVGDRRLDAEAARHLRRWTTSTATRPRSSASAPKGGARGGPGREARTRRRRRQRGRVSARDAATRRRSS